MGEAYRSCAAMGSALAAGLVYGAIADLYAPVSGLSFLIVASLSIILLVAASIHRAKAGEAINRRDINPWLWAGLAGFASLLVVADAFNRLSRATVLMQVLMTLPFLWGISYAVRQRAWLAACGAAGFFATAVAMLYCNRGGGWAGFFSVYCV